MARHALLTIFLLVGGTRIADACSCPSMPPCQRFWTADAVFTGIVTGVTYSDDKKQQLSHSTIVVERGFRGASGQVVLTGTVLSSCHYNFTVGQRYLVYAHRNADGTLSTGACSGNKLLADAQEDLDYAEHLPPPGSGGRIFGRVRLIEQDLLDRRKSLDKYPAGVAVTVRDSSGAVLELQTDGLGQFEATGLKPDKYSVSIDAPATARVYYEPTTIELKDRGCVPVYVSYQSDGRISGRIADASGRPARKVSVSAFPSKFTTKKEYPEVSMQTKITDADGRYEIGPLPPGNYRVGVNVEWPARLESPYPPTYFPGVVDRAQAETITVREGEVHRANFVLPQTLARLTVSGTVVFPDATPAPNVNVSLVAGTVSGVSTTRTDASGSFTLTGLSGSTYSVRASFYTSPENNGSAETTISLADEPVTGVKLVLKKR
jgi:Carboxypeptidase regulatory-like domain